MEVIRKIIVNKKEREILDEFLKFVIAICH